jgi:predicted porin
VAVRSAQQLQAWGGVRPLPIAGGAYLDIAHDVPIIWGPSYGSGAAAFGAIGKVDYAFEAKNTSLSGRPDTWSPTEAQWQQPTFSGRLGYRPDEMWSVGFSASEGPYLAAEAGATLPPGRALDQYTERVLGQDIGFAWHHLQLWAEAYEAQFRIPGVGNADTQAYYIEAKYKFTPQFFGAIRWNQQLFSSLPTSTGQAVEWDRNVWRIDIGPSYRFTPHMQLKLQYSVEYQQADLRNWGDLLAVQFTTRF